MLQKIVYKAFFIFCFPLIVRFKVRLSREKLLVCVDGLAPSTANGSRVWPVKM